MTKHEFATVWNYLCAVFTKQGGNKLSEDEERERMAAYFAALQDLPVDVLKASALICVQRNVWFPAVAELRAAAYDLESRAEGLPLPMEAWAEVKKNLSRLSPRWSHPLVKNALDLIGAHDFAMSDVDDEPSWRARYIEAYQSLMGRKREDATMLPEVRRVIERLADGKRLMIEG